MADADWTPEEANAIRALQRAFARKPRSILLYTLDGEVIACKQRVPSNDLTENVASSCAINAGCVLTDMHDDSPEAMERSP